MDIEKWLHGLGLQQYVTAFRDNAIDAEVLPELTDADLEKLGVLLGHRKRLLKAIAALAAPARQCNLRRSVRHRRPAMAQSVVSSR